MLRDFVSNNSPEQLLYRQLKVKSISEKDKTESTILNNQPHALLDTFLNQI